MNYLIYPTAMINITQSHLDGNHKNHSSYSPNDYPIDEACEDTGRSWFLCPCDEIEIKKIYGVGTSGINTIWMTSKQKVVTPSGEGYVTIMVEHPEDDDLKKIKIGQVFKRGEKMFREGGNGSQGAATYGNHFHISVGFGTMKDSGWASNGKAWVLTTTGRLLKADEAFYVDGQTIKKNLQYKFKTKPKDVVKSDNTSDTKPKEVIKLDNKPDTYAKEAVEWATKNKFLLGDDKGNLKLHTNITRQDLLVILYRIMHK